MSNSGSDLEFYPSFVGGSGTLTKTGSGELQFGTQGEWNLDNNQSISGTIDVKQGAFMETEQYLAGLQSLIVESGAQFAIKNHHNNNLSLASFNQGAGPVFPQGTITLNGSGPNASGALFYGRKPRAIRHAPASSATTSSSQAIP